MNKIFVFVLTILFGCGQSADKLPREVRHGINGDAIYVLKGDSVVMVYKQEFNLSINGYAILLKKDTVHLGDDFESLISIPKSDWKVTVTSPSDTLIFSGGESSLKNYLFKPKVEGVYDYRGIIEYDSIKVPFDYKFIVVKARG